MRSTSVLHGRLLATSSLLAIFMISCTLSSHLPTELAITNRALVTFIIPTLGRPTLNLAISSLQKQHDPNWKAIVVFDGVKPAKLPSDPRIQSIQIPETGKFNYAGEVRNQGMEKVTTEWIAFLDDDDYLSPDYVKCLMEELKLKSTLDVIIFRMYHPNRAAFIPAPDDKNFSEGNVGISFSMRTLLYQAGFKFNPGSTEDFNLLDRIRCKGYKMVLSPYVTYWIREAKESYQIYSTCDCSRAYINYP